jgi:hypothetical protein
MAPLDVGTMSKGYLVSGRPRALNICGPSLHEHVSCLESQWLKQTLLPLTALGVVRHDYNLTIHCPCLENSIIHTFLDE